MQPAKIKNPLEHERLLERIKKTKNINQQHSVGVQLIGHSHDAVSRHAMKYLYYFVTYSKQVIDLSQKQLEFKVRIQNRTPIAKTLNYVRVQGQRKFFKFNLKSNFTKTRIPPSSAVDIDIIFSHELDHPGTLILDNMYVLIFFQQLACKP